MGKKHTSDIELYFHCSKCLAEYKKLKIKETPAEFQKISAGWTKKGFQIWCERHQINIGNFDLEGHKLSIVD